MSPMGRPPRDPQSPSRRRNFFATDAEWAAWKAAAQVASDAAGIHMNHSTWMRTALDRAAEHASAPVLRRLRKRCPACNQLTYVADGKLEEHMAPHPHAFGRFVQCDQRAAKATMKREKGKR